MKKKLILKSNIEIANLVKMKQTIGNKYYIIYMNDSESTKIAISVSKKIGNAVVRNYSKRVVREIVSKNLSYIQNKTILIVVKKSFLEITFDEKRKTLEKLLMKVKIWVN